MSKFTKAEVAGGIGGIMLVCFMVLVSIASMVQHWVTCIGSEEWVLLAFGCVVPPIGFIHGIGVWLGWF